MKKILFILPILILFSCSVQKRKYQKGFYVSGHKAKTQVKKDDHVSVKKETKPKKLSSTPIDLPEFQKIEAEASVSKEIKPIKIKAPASLLTRDEPCDIIILKNGVEIKAKILEISPIEVKYKKCDLPDSPLYIAEKSDVFMIKYANGTKDVFKTETEPKNSGSINSSNNARNSNNNGPKETHELAVLSLVFGIAGFVLFIGSIPAIIAGNAALRKIKENPDKYDGEDLARIGKILGIVGLILKILALVLIILIVSTLSGI